MAERSDWREGQREDRGSRPGQGAGSGLREGWRELQGQDVDWRSGSGAGGARQEDRGGGFAGDYNGTSGYGSGAGFGGVGGFGRGGRGHGTSGTGTGTGYGGGYGANSRYGDDEQGREVWSEGSDGSEGPHTGRGPQGYKGRSDDRIYEDVCEALTRHGGVDAGGIIVRVEEGEVTLEGTVNSRNEKRLAVQAVEDLEGVKDVHSRLHVAGHPGGESSDATQTRGAEAAGAQSWNGASGASQTSGEGPGRSRKGVGTT